MKRILLTLVIFLFMQFNAAAQLNFLNKTASHDLKRFKENITILSHNITDHQRKIQFLKSQRKSLEEIYNYLKPDENNLTATGSISGKISAGDGVTPVQMPLIIDLFDEFGTHITSKYFSFGTLLYSINNIPSGSYYVLVTADYFYIPVYYKNSIDWHNAELVQVSDGSATNNVDFILQNYEGVITGKVQDQQGNPLNDCAIIVISEDEQKQLYGTTDINGSYFVNGIPTGQYKIRTLYSGEFSFSDEWYDNAETEETALIVNVVEPDTVKDIDFVLNKAGAISGHILKSDGQPVGEFSTSIMIYNLQGKLMNYIYNDADNSFLIKNLPSGSYKIAVHHFKPGNYSDTWSGNASNFDDAEIITVSSPDTTKGVIIKFREGGIISGIVTAEVSSVNPADITIAAFSEYYEYANEGTVLPSGEYMIQGLSSGNYKIRISLKSHLPEWYNDKKTFADADFVKVEAPSETDNINFTLVKGSSISGKVFQPDGQLLTSAAVVSAYNMQQLYSASADVVGGSYKIDNLEPGTYKLSVSSSEFANEWYNNSGSFEGAEVIEVLQGTPAVNKDFILETSGTVQGYVVNNGMRLDGVKHNMFIILFNADDGLPAGLSIGMVSFNGGYNFDVKPGTYKAATMIYSAAGNEQNNFAVNWYGGGKTFNDPLTQTITVTAGKKLLLDDISILNVTGTISGTIFKDANKNPLTEVNYQVYAFDENGYYAQSSSYSASIEGNQSNYTLTGLRPGKYFIALSLFEPKLDKTTIKWYNNVSGQHFHYAKAAIPNGVIPVEVGEGSTENIDFIMDNTTNVKDGNGPPEAFNLEQNYPNPFNPETKIRFNLPVSGITELKIYDILGHQVLDTIREFLPEGKHEFAINGKNLSTGVYIYELQQNNLISRRKMLLLK